MLVTIATAVVMSVVHNTTNTTSGIPAVAATTMSVLLALLVMLLPVTSRSRDILHRPTNLKFPPRFLLRPTNLHLHLPPRNTMDTSLLPVSTVSRLLAMPLVVRPPDGD